MLTHVGGDHTNVCVCVCVVYTTTNLNVFLAVLVRRGRTFALLPALSGCGSVSSFKLTMSIKHTYTLEIDLLTVLTELRKHRTL